MKLKKIIISLLVLYLMILSNTLATEKQHTIELKGQKDEIKIRSNKGTKFNKIDMSIKYDSLNIEDVNTKKDKFALIHLANSYRTGYVGKPQLPSTKKLIRIPKNATDLLLIHIG